MARPREFDEATALDEAIKLFADRGFERSSTQSLIEATGVGRQSLYNIYGDKWGLYLAALSRYCEQSTEAHLDILGHAPTALAAVEGVMDRVTRDALGGCLGVGATAEFGMSRPDVTSISARAGTAIAAGLRARIELAQRDAEIAAELDVDEVVAFVMMVMSGIRIAARGGAKMDQLQAMGRMALRALR